MPPDARRRFPGRPVSVADARRFVVSTLAEWDVGEEAVASGELVTSELVTNAVTHGGADTVDVVLVDDPERGRVRLTVEHPEAAAEERTIVPQLPGASATHGRGLAIVDVLSDVWGVDTEPGRRRVWCELRAPRSVAPDVAPDNVLAELDLALVDAVGPEQVSAAVTAWAARTLNADFVGLALPDTDPAYLRFVTMDLPLPAVQAYGRLPVSAPMPVTTAYRDNRAMFHETGSAGVAQFPDLGVALPRARLTALANVPVVDGVSRPLGALVFGWTRGREITAGERAMIVSAADRLARTLASLRRDAVPSPGVAD